MTLNEVGDYVRSLIGRLAGEILDAVPVSGVFVTGGGYSPRLLRDIQADGSEILSELMTGIPLIRIRGGRFDGMKLITKAGAFGDESAALFCHEKAERRNLLNPIEKSSVRPLKKIKKKGDLFMKTFLLPYGKEKLTLNVEEEHLAGVLMSELHSYKGAERRSGAGAGSSGTPYWNTSSQ